MLLLAVTLLQYSKDNGEYDSTLIIFTSDSVGSEAVQLLERILVLSVNYSALPGFLAGSDDTLPDLTTITASVVHRMQQFGSSVTRHQS